MVEGEKALRRIEKFRDGPAEDGGGILKSPLASCRRSRRSGAWWRGWCLRADRVADFHELLLDRGDARVGVAVADRTQAGGLLAQYHADVLGAAEPDADNGRLAGEPAQGIPFP
jgi:hypothetical protein